MGTYTSTNRDRKGQEETPGIAERVELERLRLREAFLTRLLRDEDPYSVLSGLCMTLQERLGACPMAVLDRVTMPRNWELRASAGFSDETLAMLQDVDARPGLTRLGWRSLQRGPIRVTEPQATDLLQAGELQLGPETGLWIQPILAPGRVVSGALVVVIENPQEIDLLASELLVVGAELAGLTLERLHSEGGISSSESTEGLLDGVTALLMVADPEGRIVQLNRAFERAFGRESSELYGSRIHELLVKDEDASLDAWLSAVVAGTNGVQYEGHWLTADEQERWVGWVASGLHDRRGRLRYIVCTGADITERRRSEREQEQVQQALLHLQKMEAVEVLVDGFVHDFNNNLTAIIGFADLAQASLTEDHPARRSLEEVLNAAKLATSLTGSLLTFTRSTGVHRGPCDLLEILDSCVQLLLYALPGSIDLEIDKGSATTLPILADPNQIQQAIVALALNARDAMPSGGVLRIAVESRPDTVLPEREAGAVSLTVEDEGMGIPEEIQRRVFQPFFTTKLRGRGSGLGLPGVQRIIREHGGSVELSSTEGVGTQMTLLLPTAEGSIAAALHGETEGGRILVADAEGLSRSIVVSGLRKAGFDVSVAAGLPEALETGLIERGEIEILILDSRSLPGDLDQGLEELWTRHPLVYVLVMGMAPELADKTDDRLGTLPRPFAMGELTRVVQSCLLHEEGSQRT